jgi:hypothetical protein
MPLEVWPDIAAWAANAALLIESSVLEAPTEVDYSQVLAPFPTL